MYCRTVELRHKEVINSKNGVKLGCVDDIEIDTLGARLVAIVIYGRPKCFGLFGRDDDIVIRWEDIELIGEDTILVSHNVFPKQNKKLKLPFLTR